MSERNKVPRLRFSEFKDLWEERVFSDLFSFYRTNSFSRTNLNYDTGEIKNIHYGDIHTKFNTNFHIDRELVPYINSELDLSKIKEEDFCKEGDIVIADASEDYNDVGKAIEIITLKGEKVLAGLHTMLVRDNKEAMALGFKGYLLKERSVRLQIMKFATGISVLGISKTNLSKAKLILPSFDEQKKIADFLTAIDDRFQYLSKRKELLQRYRKGALQKIFSQEIRFKDSGGDNYPEWGLKKLGELTYKEGKKNKENIQYPIYSINNKEGFLPQSDQFEGVDSNERGYDISLYRIIKTNTFAYNPARINVGSIGYSGELNDVIVSSLYVCFKTKEELSDHFLLAFLDTYEFKKAVLRNAEGGVRSYLFYDNFSIIKIPLPSLEEQKKITDFLITIDDEISLVEQQIEKTEAYKKGLLQQMFV